MVIRRRALSRRAVLRGVGATLALPFLDAMVPAFAAGAAQTPVKRFLRCTCRNGVIIRDLVPPSAGKDFEITRFCVRSSPTAIS